MTGSVKRVFAANRQAVVVIHGIGNQRPMDTLRPFVDAVLQVDNSLGEDLKYYSKPEDLSGTFELRRLQSRKSRPRTDFFELYWQHLIPTASWSRVYAWLALLLSRRPADVPRALLVLWWFGWATVGAVVVLLALAIVAWLLPETFFLPNWLTEWPNSPIGLIALLLLLQGLVLNHLGDAAIYLSAEPRNIRARQAVRDAGVALIERLHRGVEGEPAYDRIVVVGHSLGSVIGYDILTYAWPRFNAVHWGPEFPSREALRGAEAAAKRLSHATSHADAHAVQKAKVDWVGACRCLWLEQRKNGFPWLVTDFITLGSPLAHGLLLLARNRTEFERKKIQRELPTSPPQLEDGRAFSYRCRYEIDNDRLRTIFALHHAALFAVTLWTNLFFPARFGVKGDFVGGAVSSTLGAGIADIPVRTATRGGWLTHTSYWKPHKLDRGDTESAIAKLITALDLRRSSFR
jgi:hypothetical protein